MSDFLTRLIERTQGVAQVAQPIIPPMFAPMSNTLSEYSQNSTQDSVPFNASNRAITTPRDDSPSTGLNQPFRKTSNTRFATKGHIKSDLSEQVEAVPSQEINNQVEPGAIDDQIQHSSNLTNSEHLTNSKRHKENTFGNNESSTIETVSEYDQNTSSLPEQSLFARKEISEFLTDSDKVNMPRNLPEAERDQNISTQLKHLLNEKRDESGGLIKSEYVSALQEIVESERDQNISLQPEHSLTEKRAASEGLIDSDQESTLREVTELKLNLQPEHSLNEKQNVSGRLITIDQASISRGITEANHDQSIGPQPEHSVNEKREVSDGLIDFDQASTLRELTELKLNLQPENSINEKRETSEEPIYSDKTSTLRKITESTEVRPAETSYLNPSSLGKTRFQQATEMEQSSSGSTIKVIIGRVEVRAIMPPAPTASASRARTRSPTLSLNDYLKQRNEGQR